jgi:hypothetical protein
MEAAVGQPDDHVLDVGKDGNALSRQIQVFAELGGRAACAAHRRRIGRSVVALRPCTPASTMSEAHRKLGFLDW